MIIMIPFPIFCLYIDIGKGTLGDWLVLVRFLISNCTCLSRNQTNNKDNKSVKKNLQEQIMEN